MYRVFAEQEWVLQTLKQLLIFNNLRSKNRIKVLS